MKAFMRGGSKIIKYRQGWKKNKYSCLVTTYT
jgi:hypothetical protein